MYPGSSPPRDTVRSVSEDASWWATRARLRVGSIVEPGNWGRVIRLTGTRHGSFALEALFELTRVEVRPSAPSRFDAIFLSPSDRHAHHFQQSQARALDLIYEVRLVDVSATVFLADYDRWNEAARAVQQPGPPGLLQQACANAYWAGVTDATSFTAEVLTTSAVEIVSPPT